jgi:HK97 family phage major capsid protein
MHYTSMLKPPLGTDFAMLCALIASSKDGGMLHNISKQIAPGRVHDAIRVKTAVAAGNAQDPAFAAPLINSRALSGEFITLTDSRSVVGQLKPSMQQVPFLTRTIVETVPASASFVAEGETTPMSRLSLVAIELARAKIVTLTACTEELVSSFAPDALQSLLGLFIRSQVRGLNAAFLDPSSSPVPGGRPASITWNITPTSSTGATAAAFTSDIRGALNRMIANGSDLTNVVLLLHPHTALWASTLLTAGNVPMFPKLGAKGGELFGIPVLTSTACLSAGSPNEFIAVACDPTKLVLADPGEIEIDTSRQASLQFTDAPLPGAQAMVSLYAKNLVGIRLRRWISWARGDDSAVEIVSNLAN